MDGNNKLRAGILEKFIEELMSGKYDAQDEGSPMEEMMESPSDESCEISADPKAKPEMMAIEAKPKLKV